MHRHSPTKNLLRVLQIVAAVESGEQEAWNDDTT